jgi:Domain of unknown function (DUF4178)
MSHSTATELRQLRVGQCLNYHGVQWRVKDFSTYTDANGYETEEWLLQSASDKRYYLLREVEPPEPDDQEPATLVHWYLAEPLRDYQIYEPGGTRDLSMTLANALLSHQTPYPKLRLYTRTYNFESQTEGTYDSEAGRRHRITWDYWDGTHLWNLALEAWSDGKLAVYSTREVRPADFTLTSTPFSYFSRGRAPSRSGDPVSYSANAASHSLGVRRSARKISPGEVRGIQLILAWFLTIAGFLLMVSGM